MKPFRFNLEALLRLRRSEAEQAQEAFARALRERQVTERQVELALNEREALGEKIAGLRRGAFTASEQGRLQQADADAGERVHALRGQLQKLARAENEALEAYRTARMRVEALEKLRQHRERAHVQAQLRAEERELESLMTGRRLALGRQAASAGGEA